MAIIYSYQKIYSFQLKQIVVLKYTELPFFHFFVFSMKKQILFLFVLLSNYTDDFNQIDEFFLGVSWYLLIFLYTVCYLYL